MSEVMLGMAVRRISYRSIPRMTTAEELETMYFSSSTYAGAGVFFSFSADVPFVWDEPFVEGRG